MQRGLSNNDDGRTLQDMNVVAVVTSIARQEHPFGRSDLIDTGSA
jgi:hypothetical protein